ncbi:hypothetical protein Tco_0112058 [Tanacetum coccineum]
MITPLPQLMTPSPALTTVLTTTSILALPNFSSMFGFDQRVSTLETKLSQLKQADHFAQLLESSAQAEEPVFETADTKMPQDQGDDMGNTKDQPNVEETPRNDWFKKPERPPTLDPDWNATKSVDSRAPQQWISKIAQAQKPPLKNMVEILWERTKEETKKHGDH